MNYSYIALGSNIEPRSTYLHQAIESLQHSPSITILAKSFIYETKPVGYTRQDDFLNMVIEVDTSFSACELLDICQDVEQDLGRKRTVRYGPRTVDLDILIYNQENRETERLTLPHPRMFERAFVLIPLSDLAPELTISTTNKTVSDYIHDLPENELDGVTCWNKNY